jgi:hypothetical protein
MADHTLPIAVLGGQDLDDSTLTVAAGGRCLTKGIDEVLAERHPDRPRPTLVRVAAHDVYSLASDHDELRRAAEAADVILRSVEPDLAVPFPGAELGDRFFEAWTTFIDICKQAECRVIALNGCTFDPADHTTRHTADEVAPTRLQRFNLALVELSMAEGISVLDVDRIVAEHGAGDHVEGLLRYDRVLCEAVRDQLADVIDDYGFFDERPVLVQQGKRG